MQRAFEQLAPSNYRDRRARLARLREVLGEILGPQRQVHVKTGRRRIHLVFGEGKPPTPNLELLVAAILWVGCSVLGHGAEPPQFWVLLIWLEPGISHVTWVHFDATMCLPCFVCSILPVLHFLRFDLFVL